MKPKGFAPVLILIIIAVLGVGFYLLKQNKYFLEPPSLFFPISTATPDQTADWKTYTNFGANYTVNYPSNWSIQGSYISNYPQGEFISYKKRDEEMKQFSNPVLILLGQIFASEEYKKYDFQKQQSEWESWILKVKFPEVLQGVKPIDQKLTDVFQYKAYAQKVCSEDGYTSLNYPCQIEIYIPNGLVAADIDIYGDVENLSEITRVLSTFKFTD